MPSRVLHKHKRIHVASNIAMLQRPRTRHKTKKNDKEDGWRDRWVAVKGGEKHTPVWAFGSVCPSRGNTHTHARTSPSQTDEHRKRSGFSVCLIHLTRNFLSIGRNDFPRTSNKTQENKQTNKPKILKPNNQSPR